MPLWSLTAWTQQLKRVARGFVLSLLCCISQMIDEVHTLIGAGAAEGAIDAANILKPALARGELQCIGATTLDEYRKHIEKDPALERYVPYFHMCCTPNAGQRFLHLLLSSEQTCCSMHTDGQNICGIQAGNHIL